MSTDFLQFVIDVIVLIPVLLILCTGIASIVFGCYLYYHPGKFGANQTRQQLLKWRVVTPDSASPALLEEYARSRDTILSSSMIGMGLALVLLVCSGMAFVWTPIGTFLGDVIHQLFVPAVFMSYVLGFGLGYLYGVWRLRRLTAQRVAYGDLQPRKLSDYRSVVFPWVVVVLIAGIALITLMMEPHIGATVPLEMGDGGVARSLAPVWVLWILPAVMLLILCAGEFLLSQIARLPRLLLTSQPSTAQRADNLLRASTIGTIQGFELNLIGYLGVLHATLLTNSLWHSGFWQLGVRPLSPLLDTWYWFAALVAAAGFLFPAFAGRVGGRITGWPWRPARVL